MTLLRFRTSLLLLIGVITLRSLAMSVDVDEGLAPRKVVSNSSDVPPVDACAQVNSTMERLTTDSLYAGCSACVTRGNCLFKEELGPTNVYMCTQAFPVPQYLRTKDSKTLVECAQNYKKMVWEVINAINMYGLGRAIAAECTSAGVETALVELSALVPKKILTRRNVEAAVRIIKFLENKELSELRKALEKVEKSWKDVEKRQLHAIQTERESEEEAEKASRTATLHKMLSVTFGSISAVLCVVVAPLLCKFYIMHKERRNQGISN